ncbi:MAG TPA: hypothetical protein VFE53_24250 [Mucilaginibacter sp.]|jgi:hypothetical protein|nr:hypothetical protein [Mucilaginibacter sp.]
MKNLVLISLFLLISSIIFSCKKSSEKPAAVSIVGNWNLVSDFSVLSSAPGDTTKYFGVSSDFFNFEVNDVFTVKEGTYVSNTDSYKLGSAAALSITWNPPGCVTCTPNNSQYQLNYSITTLMVNKLVLKLVSSGPLIDLGYETEIITLSR